MKINPDCLRTVREKKGFTRPQLEKRSGITVRTIQRLEQEPHRSQKTREDTLNRLAKALSVEPGVLTGDLPLPESDDTLTDNLDRVQIGAQIAPKARLAYDLIKRRYGVNATEIINMAPLFFALLAEGSLAWRREKLAEAKESVERLHQIHAEIEHRIFGLVANCGNEAYTLEGDSIAKADIFGDYRYEDRGYTINSIMNGLFDEPFDPDEGNPFAYYLRKLADELAISNIVHVDGSDLRFGSPPKFPDYDICSKKLERIANGSIDAKRSLETGHARLSEIPEELMAKDAREERAKWLEDKLPGIYKDLGEAGDILAEHVATTSDENRKRVEEIDFPKTNSKTEKEGDDE